MGTTKSNIITEGSITSTSHVTTSGNVVAAGNVVATGNVVAGGNLTCTGESVPTDGVRIGGVNSASNEYDFFYADGTNRPKMNALTIYDYGTNAFRGVYLYNGVLKAT